MSAFPDQKKGPASEDVASPAVPVKRRSRKLLQNDELSLNMSLATETTSRILRSTTKKVSCKTKFLPKIVDVPQPMKLKFPKNQESRAKTSSRSEDEAADKYFAFKRDDSGSDALRVVPWITEDSDHGTSIDDKEATVESYVKKPKRKKRSRKERKSKDEARDKFADVNFNKKENTDLLEGVEENNRGIDQEAILTREVSSAILKGKTSEVASDTKLMPENDVKLNNPRKKLKAKRHFPSKLPQKEENKTLDESFDPGRGNVWDVIVLDTTDSDHGAAKEENSGIHPMEAAEVKNDVKPKRKRRVRKPRGNKDKIRDIYFISCNSDSAPEGSTNIFKDFDENDIITHLEDGGAEAGKFVKAPMNEKSGTADEYFDCHSDDNSKGVSRREEHSIISNDVTIEGMEENCSSHLKKVKAEVADKTSSFDMEVEESQDSGQGKSETQVASASISVSSKKKSSGINQEAEDVESANKSWTYSTEGTKSGEILPNPPLVPVFNFANSARKRKSYSGLSKAANEIKARRNTERLFKFGSAVTETPCEKVLNAKRKSSPQVLDETFDVKTSSGSFKNKKLPAPSFVNNKTLNENCEGAVIDLSKRKSPSAKSFQFEESAFVDMSPSTGDNVNENVATPIVNRRRTYELDESVSDISLLKSVAKSGKTSSGSLKDEISSLNENQPINLSKITLRRGFNTGPSYSPIDLESPPADSWFDNGQSFKNLEKSYSSPKPRTDDGKPRRTSTPIVAAKSTSLLKKTLEKSSNLRLSQSHPSTSKKSKVKIPNFSLIHQRAFDKMESVLEHKQRKEKRAKFLLSGQKPSFLQNSAEATNGSGKSTTSIKKQLRFASNVTDREKPRDFIPLPSTPMPRRQIRENQQASATPAKTPTPKKGYMIQGTTDEEVKKTPRKTPTPKKGSIIQGTTDEGIKKIKKNKKTPARKVGTPKVCVSNKENVGVLRNNPFDFKKIHQPKDGFTRFGFKVRPDAKTQETRQELKAIVSKTVAVKNTTNKRRDILKGVRSNRRFDLLMQMRNK